MIKDIISVGEDDQGRVKLEVVDGKFKGCIFTYDGVKFGETENPDGTYNMDFEYNIMNDYVLEVTDKEAFGTFLGDTLVEIIEQQIASNEVVYRGGIDEEVQS